MGKKVLLADDSATIQKLVEMALGDSDYELQAVSDGRRAIEALPAYEPDILLVDAIMPVMDGYQVCEFVKNNDKYKHLPVILLTGRFQPFDEARAEEVKIDHRIIKPFSQDQLVSTISQMLSKATNGEKGVNTHPGQAGEDELNLDDNSTVHLNENDLRAHIAGLQQDGDSSVEAVVQPAAPTEALDETIGTLHSSSADLDEGDEFGHESIEEMDEGDVTMELSSEHLLGGGDLVDQEEEAGEDMAEGAFDTLPGNVDKAALLESDSPEDDVEELAELDMDDVSFDDDVPTEMKRESDDSDHDILSMDEVAFDDVDQSDFDDASDQPISFDDDDDDLDKTVAVSDLSDGALSSFAGGPSVSSPLDEPTTPVNAEAVDLPDVDMSADELDVDVDDEPLSDLNDDEPVELGEDDFHMELQEELSPGINADADDADLGDEALDFDDDEDVLESTGDVVLETSEAEPVLLEDTELLGDVVDQVEDDTQPVAADDGDAETAPVDEGDAETAPVDEADAETAPVEEESQGAAADGNIGVPQGVADNQAAAKSGEDVGVAQTSGAIASTAKATLNSAGMQLSDQQLRDLADKISDMIIEKMGSDAVKDIVWQVVPELAEAMIKKRIYQLEQAVDHDN